MAATIAPKTDKYIDLPLTEFPVKEDTVIRMQDINAVQMPLVKQYNEYFAAGNKAACDTLLSNNPEVLSCFFNADKFNWARDAIIALQRYYLEDVVTFINNVAANTVGVEDNPTEEQANTVAYSAFKVDQIIENLLTQLRTLIIIDVPSSGWSDTYPFVQTIAVDSIKGNLNYDRYTTLDGTEELENVKAYNKAFGFIFAGETTDGELTLYAYKKPVIDFSIALKEG